MSIIFKSKATGDLLMVTADAQRLLTLLGKEGAVPGILQPEEMPNALDVLRTLPNEDSIVPEGADAEDDLVGAEWLDQVSPRTRAWPLVRMIEAALAAKESIVWGV